MDHMGHAKRTKSHEIGMAMRTGFWVDLPHWQWTEERAVEQSQENLLAHETPKKDAGVMLSMARLGLTNASHHRKN